MHRYFGGHAREQLFPALETPARALRLWEGMVYVITESCVGTCDTACVDVCPVDCIHGSLAAADVKRLDARERMRLSLQMYIDAEACICCAACVPECPVEAIVEDDELPPDAPSIRAAAAFFRDR